MADDNQARSEGVTRGYRVPNFALPARDERTLLFYEFAHGAPLLLAASATGWTEEDSRRFARAVHEAAQGRNVQSVVLVGRPSELDEHPSDAATAVDESGAVRRRLFGSVFEGTEGALVVTDPNLRVINGAAVERAALSADTLTTGLESLVDDCLAELKAEAEAGPAVAPVLIVPRVLPIELCRGLVDGFGSWNATPSPMPQPDGAGLAVDPDRKSRLDAMIGDPKLERELMVSIARRVLPEIAKAFQFRANRFERLKLVCYRASEAGHFGAHRDNTAPTTGHRRFALTLNLNTGDYDGGHLAFPEYGPSCAYDVAAGSAIIFSCTHAHRVLPVTRGERYALISFAYVDGGAGQSRAPGPPPPPA